MDTPKAKRPFYGWVVVLACMMLAAASTGLLSYFSALFVTPVSVSLGVPRATLAVYSTVFIIVSMAVMPFAGSLFKKFPLKLLILAGSVLGAGAQLCYSFSGSVYGFYLGAVLGGIGNCLFGSVPIAILTSNWFIEKKGVATGLAFAGTGLVTSTLSPVISWVIATWGWRVAYRLLGCGILLLTLLAVMLIRTHPGDMGLKPLGEHNPDAPPAEPTGFTRKQIFTLPAFWCFALAVFLIGAATMGTQQQLVSYWADMGNSADTAARLYSLMMFVAIFAKIILGIVYDKTGVRLATVISCTVAAAALLGLTVFTTGIVAAVPAILFGIATAIQVLTATYVTNALFGTREYASTYGLMTTILYLGVAVGGLFSARVFDSTGSYRPAWVVFAAVFLVAMAAILVADRLSRKAFRQILGVERDNPRK